MEKIEIVRSYWKAEGSKNLQNILSHFAQDAVFSSPTMQLKGREQIKIFYEGMVDGFLVIEVVPKHWIESGEDIAVEYDCYLTRKSGEKRHAKGFNIFHIGKGNKISGLRCYFNPADF